MSNPDTCGSASLTDADRATIAKARQLAGLRTTSAITERFPGWVETGAAYAEAFGLSRYLMEELAGIAERLGGEQ